MPEWIPILEKWLDKLSASDYGRRGCLVPRHLLKMSKRSGCAEADMLVLHASVYYHIVDNKLSEDGYERTMHGTPRDAAGWREMDEDMQHIKERLTDMHRFPDGDKAAVEH